MNKTLRWTLILLGVVVVAAALVSGGVLIARAGTGTYGFGPGTMMNGYAPDQPGYGYMVSGGMMQTSQNYSGTLPYGPGMMDGEMMGMMGGSMMNGGMMSGGYRSPLYGVEPLSLDQATQAVEEYLAGLSNSDLALGEVMVFDNHAYAQIVEQSTGVGALEVLVDPVTLAIYPEYGPNMMWNQKYRPMGGFGGMGVMGMMMGNFSNTPTEVTAEMPVSGEQTIETAQRYLDTYLPGAKTEDKADPFYGYYTLHIVRDGKTVGMLSVNGYTRQVFVHTWHGDFVELSEE